jgi:MtN3 and saliva related transmembrane protein
MSVIFYNQSESILNEWQNNILTDVIGYSANAIISIRLLIQDIKTLKTKSARDLSFKYLWVSLLGTILMLVYGVLINQLPIVVVNPIIIAEIVILIVAKFVYDKKNDLSEVSDIELAEISKNNE